MVEQPSRRSYEPDHLEQDITGTSRPRPTHSDERASVEYQSDDSVPLFLSDPDGEPDPGEFDYETQLRAPRASRSPDKS